MDRQIQITSMTFEEYLNKYGHNCKDENILSYPLEEIELVFNDTQVNTVALIDGRLYEVPKI